MNKNKLVFISMNMYIYNQHLTVCLTSLFS